MIPKVTVLMSVYNSERYLREAMESILKQTFGDFEFLIINDGSTDSSREIILSYQDPRIRLIENKQNIGLTKSLNIGLKEAKGEYIARMDADDISLPERLEKQVGYLNEHGPVGVLGSKCYMIDTKGAIIGRIVNPAIHKKIMGRVLLENQMVHSSIMYRKKVLNQVGGYNDAVRIAQDYELLLRLAEVTVLANYPQYLHQWRQSTPGGVTRTKRSVQIKTRDTYRKEYLERNFNPESPRFIGVVVRNYVTDPKDSILETYYKKIESRLSWLHRSYIAFRITINKKRIKLFLKKMKKIVQKSIRKAVTVLSNKGIIVPSHPRSIIFLMKNICNAKCIMCGLNYQENSKVCEITLQDYQKMVGHLDMKKVEDVCFSGGGDPLLATDLIPIMEYTQTKFPWVKQVVYTNGIALGQTKAEELTNYPLDMVVISVNAAKKESYHQVIRVDVFDQVKEHVRNFIQIKNKKQPKTKVQLSFVASKLNVEDLPDFVRMAKELGADEVNVQYSRMYSKRFNLDKKELDTSFDKQNSLFFHQELSDNMMQEAITVAKQLDITLKHEPLFADPFTKPVSCTWPMTALMVGPEGEIYPCGGGEVMFYEAIRDKKLNFGNLLDDRIEKIWNCDDFKTIRESCKGTNKNKKMPQCYNCNHTMSWEGPQSEKSHILNFD